jgi:hypothetical protein
MKSESISNTWRKIAHLVRSIINWLSTVRGWNSCSRAKFPKGRRWPIRYFLRTSNSLQLYSKARKCNWNWVRKMVSLNNSLVMQK